MVLYDNNCKMCSSFVVYILKFRVFNPSDFIGLSSNKGKTILTNIGLNHDYNKSVVYIHNNKVFLKSDAIIQLIGKIGFFYKTIFIIKLIPQKLLDKSYDFFAKRRACSKHCITKNENSI